MRRLRSHRLIQALADHVGASDAPASVKASETITVEGRRTDPGAEAARTLIVVLDYIASSSVAAQATADSALFEPGDGVAVFAGLALRW